MHEQLEWGYRTFKLQSGGGIHTHQIWGGGEYLILEQPKILVGNAASIIIIRYNTKNYTQTIPDTTNEDVGHLSCAYLLNTFVPKSLLVNNSTKSSCCALLHQIQLQHCTDSRKLHLDILIQVIL